MKLHLPWPEAEPSRRPWVKLLCLARSSTMLALIAYAEMWLHHDTQLEHWQNKQAESETKPATANHAVTCRKCARWHSSQCAAVV